MDNKIDTTRMHQLRQQKSWSQDQLASISGLSLRTVQRIEKSGVCSLESQLALAAAFQVDVMTLQIDAAMSNRRKADRANFQGTVFGMVGNTVGILCGLGGVIYSAYQGNMDGYEAGLWAGGIGLFGGAVYWFLAWSHVYWMKQIAILSKLNAEQCQ